MHQRRMFATLLYFACTCAGREQVDVHFSTGGGSITETRKYDAHRAVFAVSEYLKTKVGGCLSGGPAQEKEVSRIVLECAPSIFEIAADLLEDRAPDVEVRGDEVVGVLHLVKLLDVVGDRALLYGALAKATISDASFREEIQRHRDAPDVKLFMLQLLRDYAGRYDVHVRVCGGRATVCFDGEDTSGYCGSEERVEAVGAVRIFTGAVSRLMSVDRCALETMKSFLGAMDICELEMSGCYKLGASVVECIGDMASLQRLRISVKSHSTLRGLEHLKSLENLVELDISGSRPGGLSRFWPGRGCARNASLSAIGSLTGLKKLDIQSCRLKPGSLEHIKGLEHLTELSVCNNRLGRKDMRVIGSMGSLARLSVGYCELGPGSIEPLGGLGRLRELNASGNVLSGRDMSAIGKMKGLTLLDVGSCGLGPEDLEHLRGLGNLEEIDVSGSTLEKGSISVVGSMKGLRRLHMRDCRLGPGCFDQLGDLESLEELDISRTELGRDGMSAVGRMRGLVALKVGSCRLHPGSLEHLRGLEKISELDVSWNAVSTEDLAAIGDMAGLTRLNMYSCSLEAGGLLYIQRLGNIQSLNISCSRLSKGDMSVVGRMSNLRTLCMFRCDMELGSLVHIKDLANLTDLDVHCNKLSRDDMRAVGGMKGLARLDISSCRVELECLVYLRDLKSLESLDLSSVAVLESEEPILNMLRSRGVYVRT